MKTRSSVLPYSLVSLLILSSSLFVPVGTVAAAPVLTSVVPARMVSGVPPSAPIIFTFSEAMNPALTTAQFMDSTTYQFLTAFTTAWSAGNSVLTCTPTAPLPAHMIVWMVSGASPAGAELNDGSFFTVGAGETGCDPAAPMLSFTVSQSRSYVQSSADTPALNTNHPYCFLGCMTLPCPRNATNVTLRGPVGPAANMTLSPIPGHLTLLDCSFADQAALDQAYPSGDYLFTIQSVSSNQAVTVNLPAGQSCPPAPRVSNFAAARAVDPAQPFVLRWDPLPVSSSAQCVMLEIYGVLSTPPLGEPGAMNGAATSFTIPPAALAPNQTYPCGLTFQTYALVTNSTGVMLTYCGAVTEFDLVTTGGTSIIVLTNAACSLGTGFTFEVTCAPGQQLVAEYSSNLAPNQWQPFATTNTTAARLRFTDPRPLSSSPVFYRVRTGP